MMENSKLTPQYEFIIMPENIFCSLSVHNDVNSMRNLFVVQ